MRKMANRNFELQGNISETVADLQDVVQERDAAREKGKQLGAQVTKLQNQIADLHESEEGVLVRLIEQTAANIESVEAVLERTGVNPDKLIAQLGPEDDDNGNGTMDGKGGPFEATTDNASAAETPADGKPIGMIHAQLASLDHQLQRWEDLRELMRRLPLAAPVDYIKITSGFGKRRDPINHRLAMHYGLDFGGVLKTPVYATAPGTVTFVGRDGPYGRLVVIDHGGGVKTRYGHLYKILVKKGEKVDYRHRIGLMGNSGRSTGPHVHYEVRVNGKPRDPWLFIKAGSYVYKG
jgi:murein DD-endopeptidase MepM/ murein hydrolase activator NlpD